MGANNSRSESEITQSHLEIALEKQRKIYEKQTKALLQIQRESLAKAQEKQSTSEATSSPFNTPGSLVTNSIYPNLPGPSNGNQFPVPEPSYNRNVLVQNRGPTQLISRFQVPVQYSTPTAPPLPIYSQETQSSIMQTRGRLTNQPTNTFRHHRLKRDAEPCPNYVHGCSLHFEQLQLTEHLKECPFNDMICPMNSLNGCSWKGKINHIKVHFAHVHLECLKARANREEILHINGNYQFLNLITIESYNFFLHIQVDHHTKKICFGVQLLGSQVSAAKWTYVIRVYNKKEPRRLFEYVDKCHSNCVPLRNIIDQFATINLDYAKTLSEQDVITFKVFLQKEFKPNERNEQPHKEHAPNGNSNRRRYGRRT